MALVHPNTVLYIQLKCRLILNKNLSSRNIITYIFFNQGDFASAASGLLASEPQSMAEPVNFEEIAADEVNAVIIVNAKNGKQIVINPIDDKKLKEMKTLKQHYYPEGGWGWIIILVTFLVHTISVGFPIGLGMFLLDLPPQLSMPRKMEIDVRENAGRIKEVPQ